MGFPALQTFHSPAAVPELLPRIAVQSRVVDSRFWSVRRFKQQDYLLVMIQTIRAILIGAS